MMQVLLAVLKMLNIKLLNGPAISLIYISKRNENKAFPGGPWLRSHAPSAGGPGLIPGSGTKPHMPY